MTARSISGVLTMWVIYERPRDYPKHYVVRRQHVAQSEIFKSARRELFDSAEHAREWLLKTCPHLSLAQRAGEDPDPVIFEVYW